MAGIKNIKVAPRMIGGFLIIAGFTAFAAFMGISRVCIVNHDTDIITQDRLPQTQASMRLQILQKACRVNLLELSLVRTRMDQWEHYKESYQDKAEEFGKWAQGMLHGNEELGINAARKGGQIEQFIQEALKEFIAFDAIAEELIEHKKQLIEQVNAGKIRASEALVDERLKKLVREELRVASRNLEEPIEAIDVRAEGQIAAAVEDAHHTAKSTRTTLIIVLIIGVTAAIGIGFFIANSISKPLTQLRDVSSKLAEGNTDVNLTINQKDEIGEVASALERVISAERAIEDGIVKVSRGDMNVDLQTRSESDKLTIAVLQMVEIIRGLVAEADMLSKATVEGKLDTRGDASKFQGDFAGIVKGVNDTLDAVIGPLNVAAEYVDRISKGDIPEKITDVYTGDFNEIKNNLNELIDSLNHITAIATKIAEGNLAIDIEARSQNDSLMMVLAEMVVNLNDILGNVDIAVEQIDSGSGQVSDSSQALSQGATESASSLEEITSFMQVMASQTKQNAENATQASRLAADSRKNADEGN